MRLLAMPKVSESRPTSVSLAVPFSGGAVTLTRRIPSWKPTTSFRDAFGWTYTRMPGPGLVPLLGFDISSNKRRGPQAPLRLLLSPLSVMPVHHAPVLMCFRSTPH